VAFLTCYTVVATFGGAYVLQDGDTFWHIRAGTWILDHRQLPTVDIYSYTALGKPWIATDWLSELLLATAYRLGGWRAVVDLTAFGCAAITGILCYYFAKHLRVSVCVGATAIISVLIAPHFVARPVIFSYVMLCVWMCVLMDTYDGEKWNKYTAFVLIPLMILWANIHAGFTFGLVLFYIFSGIAFLDYFSRSDFGRLRRIAVLAVGVSVAALVTPYGVASVLMTTTLLNTKLLLAHVQEWSIPNFQADAPHLAFVVGVFAFIAFFGIRLRGPRILTLILVSVLGLKYLRGLVMFSFLVPLILARPAAQRVRYLRAPDPSKIGAADPVLTFLDKHAGVAPAMCLVIAVAATLSPIQLTTARPPDSVAPAAALNFVKQAGIKGKVFNSYEFGGYLIFSGIPVFIDGRAQLYGDAFLETYDRTISVADIDGALKTLDDYRIGWAILAPDAALAKVMARSPVWNEVYSDRYAVVLVRR
jgi:hypothetical protein